MIKHNQHVVPKRRASTGFTRLWVGMIAIMSFAFVGPTGSVGTQGLEEALERAYHEGKQVLVPFGANW